MKRFVYYQPNPADLKDEYGDCTVRALSKVWECSWLEAFDREIPFCRKYYVSSIFDVPAKVRKQILEEMGFAYNGLRAKKGSHRPTVDSFAKDHPHGRYVLSVAGHVVAVVEGKYYDTNDSGDRSVYGFYEWREP